MTRIHGPALDDDEAIALANNSAYGPTATAWTKDPGPEHRTAKRLMGGTMGLRCQTWRGVSDSLNPQ